MKRDWGNVQPPPTIPHTDTSSMSRAQDVSQERTHTSLICLTDTLAHVFQPTDEDLLPTQTEGYKVGQSKTVA